MEALCHQRYKASITLLDPCCSRTARGTNLHQHPQLLHFATDTPGFMSQNAEEALQGESTAAEVMQEKRYKRDDAEEAE